MRQHKVLTAGFTLVEVALVVVIGGLLMAAGATMLNDYLQESRMVTTQNRMQDIDNAILQYLNVNGVLPCVAPLNVNLDLPGFGVQIANAPADCYTKISGGNAFLTTGRTSAGNPVGRIVEGAVPVRTLGLPDQEAVDAWGSRFIYGVTDLLTVDGSYDPTLGSIYVKDSAGNNVALPAGTGQYVIVSLGMDMAGAYTVIGKKNRISCPTTELEGPNCTFPQSTFIKTTQNSAQVGPNYYDDYVTFHTLTNSTGTVPSGLIAPFNLAACPSGWATGSDRGYTVCTSYFPLCCEKQ